MELQRSNVSVSLIAVLLLAGMAIVFMGQLPPLVSPAAEAGRAAIKAIPPVILNDHALIAHPIDAPLVRQCLKDKGAYEVWYRKSDSKYFLVCQLDDLRYGFQEIVQSADKLWQEVTAFVKNSGTYKELSSYLGRFATRINTPPWLLP